MALVRLNESTSPPHSHQKKKKKKSGKKENGKKVKHEENSKFASHPTRNKPSRSKIMLKKKNRCLKSKEYTQTDTPALVRLNAHEVVRTSKYVYGDC